MRYALISCVILCEIVIETKKNQALEHGVSNDKSGPVMFQTTLMTEIAVAKRLFRGTMDIQSMIRTGCLVRGGIERRDNY